MNSVPRTLAEVGIFSGFIFVMWAFEILTDFTFTDWYDFLPLAFLLTGLMGVISRIAISGKYSDRAAKLLLPALATWPLWPHLILWRLAVEARKFIGSWPYPMVNDPKWMLGDTAGYDLWFSTITYAEAMAGAAMVVFIAAITVESFARRKPCHWSLAICGLSVLIFALDPGRLYAWWLD